MLCSNPQFITWYGTSSEVNNDCPLDNMLISVLNNQLGNPLCVALGIRSPQFISRQWDVLSVEQSSGIVLISYSSNGYQKPSILNLVLFCAQCVMWKWGARSPQFITETSSALISIK